MATHSSVLARKVAWTEPGGLQSIGLQSRTQLSVCVCSHTHTHRRTLPPKKPTFIYLEVTVCDGTVREFKVVLLGELGLLTLSTRGDCPLCQPPKADTVCPERKPRQSWVWGPRSQCRILMGVPLYQGVLATAARVARKKSRPRLCFLFRAELASTAHPKPRSYSPEEPSLWFLPLVPLWWHLLQALVIMILNLLSTRVTPWMFWFFFLPVCCCCSELPWGYFKTNC